MKKSKHNDHSASNIILGMAAGAAVSAAGIYYASQNQRQVKKATKKLGHTAENAISSIDKAVTSMTQHF